MSPNWRRGTAGHPVARGLARTAVAASVATHLRSLLKRGQMHRPFRRLCYLQPDRCGTGPFAAKDAAAVRMPNGSDSDVADCLPWLCSRTSPKGIGRRLRGQGLVPSAGPIQPRSCKTLWTPRRPQLSAFMSLIDRGSGGCLIDQCSSGGTLGCEDCDCNHDVERQRCPTSDDSHPHATGRGCACNSCVTDAFGIPRQLACGIIHRPTR